MRLNDLQTYYRGEYDNEGSRGRRNVLRMLDLADQFSPAARAEFVRAFSLGKEFRFEGQLYLGTRRSAQIKNGNLLHECEENGWAVTDDGGRIVVTIPGAEILD